MICKNCGCQNDKDSKFCCKCGSNLQFESEIPRSNIAVQAGTYNAEMIKNLKTKTTVWKIIMIVFLCTGFGWIIAWILWLIYMKKYGYIIRSIIDLEKTGRSDYIYDIQIDKPEFTGSGICCGANAFYFQKTHQFIAYEDVLWIYVKRQVTNYYGLKTTTQESIEFYNKHKRHISVVAGRNEIDQLISKYIAPRSPYLLVGFTEVNKAKYNELKKQYS